MVWSPQWIVPLAEALMYAFKQLKNNRISNEKLLPFSHCPSDLQLPSSRGARLFPNFASPSSAGMTLHEPFHK